LLQRDTRASSEKHHVAGRPKAAEKPGRIDIQPVLYLLFSFLSFDPLHPIEKKKNDLWKT
jgi:hypothetical protein